MKRREKGDGSIFYRQSRGVYEARWRGRSVTAKTRPDVVRRLQALKEGKIPPRKRKAPAPEPPPATLADFVPRFLNDRRAAGVSDETITVYTSALRRVTRSLGHLPLAAITPEQIAVALGNLGRGDDPYAPASIRKSRTVLRALYATAEEWELVTRNPVKARAPKQPPRPPLAVSVDQGKAIIAALEGTRAHGPAVLGLYLGMRIGEILGLRWTDIADGRLTVQGQYLDTLKYKARTKSGAVRVLPVLGVVDAAFRQARVQQATDELARRTYERTGFVFTGPSGRPVSRSLIHGTLTARLGSGRVRFHDLRHMTASLLHDLGNSEDVRREILGHESAEVHRGYIHVGEAARVEALRRLEAALG